MVPPPPLLPLLTSGSPHEGRSVLNHTASGPQQETRMDPEHKNHRENSKKQVAQPVHLGGATRKASHSLVAERMRDSSQSDLRGRCSKLTGCSRSNQVGCDRYRSKRSSWHLQRPGSRWE